MFKINSLFTLAVMLMTVFALAPIAGAEQVTKEGTITIPIGSSNAVLNIECYARGVGKPQANEIVKLALVNSGTTTAKVDFAVAELDGTYTVIASQTYTAGANTYLNNAPFYKFSTGTSTLVTDSAGSTNTVTAYGFAPYMAKTLRISVGQTGGANAVATTYTYQVITR
jgi:hypothetical protein